MPKYICVDQYKLLIDQKSKFVFVYRSLIRAAQTFCTIEIKGKTINSAHVGNLYNSYWVSPPDMGCYKLYFGIELEKSTWSSDLNLSWKTIENCHTSFPKL